MKTQEHYETDLLFFFDGKPLELSLYEMLFRRMEAAFPAAKEPDQLLRQASFRRRVAAGAQKAGLAGALYRRDHWAFLPTGIAPRGCGGGTVPQPLDASCADIRGRAD